MKLVVSKLNPDPREDTRMEATDWCKNHQMDVHTFLEMLGINGAQEIDRLFSSEFKVAKRIVDGLPVKMGGAGAITLLYYLCEHTKASCVIETGVANGWSSLAFLLSLKNRDGMLISTDMPYAKMRNEDFVGCVVPRDLRKNWTLIRKADVSGLPIALKKSEYFDLCHYDSDKTYKGRMWAYPLLWEKIRTGGFFVSDDVGDNLAFKDFADSMNMEPWVVRFEDQFVGIMIKK